MTTHLSTRLVWHDRAWDGHICDHPSKNAYCIVQQHIRAGRDDDREALLRNTNMFVLAVRLDSVDHYYAEHLIHRTPPSPQHPNGILVRSKSEVIVAGALSKLGISYEYEQKLSSKDDVNDFRLPDFTVSYEGDTFYWEHLGMLSVPSYKEAWERKRQWYEDNGFLDRVITSEDGADGSINAAEIERIARTKILLEG